MIEAGRRLPGSLSSHSPVVEEGDYLGWALTAGDFNADGYVDLLIGVPHEDLLCGVNSNRDAGAANVVYGATSGLSATAFPDQFLSQPCP